MIQKILQLLGSNAHQFLTKIKVCFIILKINNEPMETVKDFKNACNTALKKDKKLYIAGVYPTTGKVAYYEVKLEK